MSNPKTLAVFKDLEAFRALQKTSGLGMNPQTCTTIAVMFGDYITKNICLVSKLPTCGT